VDFGLHFGTRGCLASRDNILTMAQQAEAQGYAIVGVADHLIVPTQTAVRYAYTDSGVWPGADTGECLDAIATLAFLAGCTQRIKLLTSVIVVPQRPAVLAAKLFLTADVLSGGRVIAGVGTGWMPEEFAALGAPPFEERGAVTDEFLTAWKALWTERQPAMAGRYTAFDNVMFEPKPVSKPHPPIWVGGESAPALRRTAAFGDAWYPVSNNAHIPLNTPALMKTGIDRLHRAAEKIGRDPGEIDIALVYFRPPSTAVKYDAEGNRQMFTGGAAAMLDDAAAFAAVGVKHLIVYVQAATLAETLEAQQRFAEDVIRKAR
jgi:probable F420-dependent oxidoreductase